MKHMATAKGIEARKLKREERKWFDPKEDAFHCGCENAYRRNPRKNPYPKGKRHDAFNYGMEVSKPYVGLDWPCPF